MGRHRSDPVGVARLALVGLAVLLLLAVVVIGAKGLLSTFGSGEPAAGGSSTPSAPSSAGPSAEPSAGPATPGVPSVPTVRVVCQADRCPVFVRVPGGDVLIDRDLTRGEQAAYFQPELDVVLDDAGTVEVFENGTARSPGSPGERQAFSVKRAPGQ